MGLVPQHPQPSCLVDQFLRKHRLFFIMIQITVRPYIRLDKFWEIPKWGGGCTPLAPYGRYATVFNNRKYHSPIERWRAKYFIAFIVIVLSGSRNI